MRESFGTPEELQKMREIYEKYEAMDYWGNAALIEQTKAERDQRDPSVTDQQIEDYFHEKSQGFVRERAFRILYAVDGGDYDWLVEAVRYDQPMSLELFELVTGEKVKGLSNKKLAKVFARVCELEVK